MIGATPQRHRWRLVGQVLLLVLGCAMVLPGSAAERATEALSRGVYAELKKAQEKVDAQQYPAALTALRALRDRKLSQYERSQVWNLTAYVHYLRGDYPKAITAYREVLAYDRLAVALKQSTQYTLAQLYFTEERYREALAVMRELLAGQVEADADQQLFLGQIHYRLTNYADALGPIRQAIKLQRAQRRVPEENALLLLNAVLHELGRYRDMEPVLGELIERYPKDAYLLALAGVYGELGQSAKQTAVIEALYESGTLSGPQRLQQLAQLFLAHGVPYKAALLLQSGLDDGRLKDAAGAQRLLAQAWHAAAEHERALVPLAAAAKATGDARLYRQLGHAQMQLGRWPEAAVALRNALAADDDPSGRGQLHLLLGIALYQAGQPVAAVPVFERAATFAESRDAAREWLAQLSVEAEAESQRRDAPDYSPRPDARQMIEALGG